MKIIFRVINLLTILTLSVFISFSVQAEGFNEGPKKCQECHEEEYEVWKSSPHFKSYKAVHKTPEAKKIINPVNGFAIIARCNTPRGWARLCGLLFG